MSQNSQQQPLQQHPELQQQQQQQLSTPQSSTFQQWIEQEPTNNTLPPRVLEFSPLSGTENDTLRITLALSSASDLQIISMLRIAIGSCVSPTCFSLIDPSANYVQLTAPVPHWQLTNAADRSRTPVYVIIQQQHDIIDNWFIGYFTYDYSRKRASIEYNAFSPQSTTTTAEASGAATGGGGSGASAKRTRRAESLSMQPEDPTIGYGMSPTDYKGYPGYYGLQKLTYIGQYTNTQPQVTFTQPTMAAPQSSHGYYEDTMASPAQMMGYPSYRSASFSGCETGTQFGYQTDPTAGMISSSNDPTGAAAAAAATATAAAGIPMGQVTQHHARTSSLFAGTQTSPTSTSGLPPQYMASQEPMPGEPVPASSTSSVSSSSGGGGGGSYLAPAPHPLHTIAPAPSPTKTTSIAPIAERNQHQQQAHIPQTGTEGSGELYGPYAHIVNKPNLHVEGNLDTMLENWTEEELTNQRRLVQFWRRQSENEVICHFSPVSQSERPEQQSMIVVSCIYWEDRNDYFITSVDCIYLLESLIAVRFTVEEKNRIRRNLEGFKPLTVSKLRSDSAEFFKLIMAFPNPKPRNIEKDVKVFPWRSLGLALKKIISNYTASYSSTASVNLDVLNYLQLPGGRSSTSPNTGEGSSSVAAQQQHKNH